MRDDGVYEERGISRFLYVLLGWVVAVAVSTERGEFGVVGRWGCGRA